MAERDLEIEVMKEVAAKNWRACRLAGGKLRMAGNAVSRRAAGLHAVLGGAIGAELPGPQTAKDAPVIERMEELSAQYPRYGYRRIRIFLGREGYRMSPCERLSGSAQRWRSGAW